MFFNNQEQGKESEKETNQTQSVGSISGPKPPGPPGSLSESQALDARRTSDAVDAIEAAVAAGTMLFTGQRWSACVQKLISGPSLTLRQVLKAIAGPNLAEEAFQIALKLSAMLTQVRMAIPSHSLR